ncbi:hypothetical protein LZ683_13460 [Comamonas testosteroni]|uniref:hypothetical protein n=1 Tax=Comamonas testosteroni TaxID=285 RepID=UPI0023AAD3AB|nr:hypothetical protein [Comamonas testosteroni]WEE80277.1 hypothetical protein LZ683_13460 [Comamonas testosteroni]
MSKQGISVFIWLIETAINRKNVLEQASAKPKRNPVVIDHCAMTNGLSPEFIPEV